MKRIALTAATALVACTLSGAASAKDWIETVSLTRSGIDTGVIKVRANGNGYTAPVKGSYDLHLEMHARATSGGRIVGMTLGGPGVVFLEHNPGWEQTFSGRDTGSGQLRTVTLERTVRAPMTGLTWQGGVDPVDHCNGLMNYLMSQGHSKASVLSQSWDREATVKLGLSAGAARKMNSGYGKWHAGNTYDESATLDYRVRVECMPTPGIGNQLQAPGGKPQASVVMPGGRNTGARVLIKR